MKYALCVLLSSLGGCHQAGPTGSQYPATQANPLLGHWHCNSVASVGLAGTEQPRA